MNMLEAVQPTGLGTWKVELELSEDATKTVALATLRAGRRTVQERGVARRSPADPNLPRVGEDIAVSRALSLLAHDLLSDAVSQLEIATHAPAGIRDA
jgi:hypothetical protein